MLWIALYTEKLGMDCKITSVIFSEKKANVEYTIDTITTFHFASLETKKISMADSANSVILRIEASEIR